MRALLLAFFASAMIGCAASAPSPSEFQFPYPVFEVYALRGTIRYLGGEYMISAASNDVAEVRFNPPIRKVHAIGSPTIVPYLSNGILSLAIPSKLESDGERFEVTLFDGRKFPIHVFPEADSTSRASLRASGTNAPRNQLAEVRRVLEKAMSADQRNRNISEFKTDFTLFNHVAYSSGAIRAIFLKSYVGTKYTVHVIEVQNLSDQIQELDESFFPFHNVRRVKFRNRLLPPHTSALQTASDRDRVYVVVAS